MCLLTRSQDKCDSYRFRNSILYSAVPSAFSGQFLKVHAGICCQDGLCWFLVDQVTPEHVSVNVLQSSVKYPFMIPSETVCAIRWIDSERNRGWSSTGRQSVPIMKKYILPWFKGVTPRVTWVLGLAKFFEGYEMRLKKELSVECCLCWLRAEAKETVECLMFSTWIRAEAEETVECLMFSAWIRAEAEETVECLMFSTWSRAEAEETDECLMFCAWSRVAAEETAECRMFSTWSRAEAEETAECRMFSVWRTSWSWINSWVFFCVNKELKLK